MKLTEKRFIDLMQKKFNQFEKYFNNKFVVSFHFKFNNGNNLNIYFDKISYINSFEKASISFYDRKNKDLKNIGENETDLEILEKKINQIINNNTLIIKQ